jgi:enediyne biosynthesis protein E4
MMKMLVLLALVVSINPLPTFRVETIPLRASVCSDTFVAHDLPHVTSVKADPITTFDSNGAGLGINDLDGDGRLDIVLANLDSSSTILWNEGNLRFTSQPLPVKARLRAVALVDVDGDGALDITYTTQLGSPSALRNEGNRQFTPYVLKGVRQPAYTLNWGDMDLDGDLDLVGASYDAELSKVLRGDFLFRNNGGVFLYENRPNGFKPTRISGKAQGLALLLTDLTGDSRPDIAVGNDFSLPDEYWTQQGRLWSLVHPFSVTTFSTMSFDTGDVDNDGRREFYATDMQPYDDAALPAWEPVLTGLAQSPRLKDDLQVIRNVLQTEAGEQAEMLRVDATGWSWSGKFGDLDADGYLDLYVVNGMIAADLFGHLPGNELVEENQAFRGDAGQGFIPMRAWGLNSTRSGRGMSMADLDGDGDLDIVVNNLMSETQLFENRLCGGSHLIVSLRREDVPNTHAVGAVARLYTSAGMMTRDVRALSGYLSGDPSQLHFGIPEAATLDDLEILWGDGEVSRIDALTPNTHLKITRF